MIENKGCMENKGCITCRKCEQVRINFYCGRRRLTQKQLYKPGFCSKYEPREQAKAKPMTNDEWRRTCSAEEFAELLSDAMWYGEQCATEGVLCENCKCPWCEGISNWLKQPHKGKE